jgi:hypothetical protein
MPRNDHDDLKSGGGRDLSSLKRRLARKAETGQSVSMMTLTGPRVRAALEELDALKDLIRSLYNDSISCEDARDFTIGVQEQLEALIRSWGENPMSPEEYMEAQRVAEERRRDEAEFERLRKKLGR